MAQDNALSRCRRLGAFLCIGEMHAYPSNLTPEPPFRILFPYTTASQPPIPTHPPEQLQAPTT